MRELKARLVVLHPQPCCTPAGDMTEHLMQHLEGFDIQALLDVETARRALCYGGTIIIDLTNQFVAYEPPDLEIIN